ncbi:MAG: hypothetical protein PHW24_03615 [Candidatus Moranbacteria bacterium]|nr:hypothetical protein [Candidatus Moranbacteria bacterium]
MRDPKGLNLKAFDLVASDRFAKRYIRGGESEAKTLKIACNDHEVSLAVVIHNAELIIPDRFNNDRKKEEYFHRKRMMEFGNKFMDEHPNVRFVPIFVRIVDGDTLEYVSFEGLFYGGEEKVVWRVAFSFRNVVSCEYLLIMCLDFRFRKECFDFSKAILKMPYFHLLGIPGASQGIINDDKAVIESLQNALKSGVRKVAIIHHANCTAYKKDVENLSISQEEEFHRVQLFICKRKLHDMGFEEVFTAFVRLSEDRSLMRFVVVK